MNQLSTLNTVHLRDVHVEVQHLSFAGLVCQIRLFCYLYKQHAFYAI